MKGRDTPWSESTDVASVTSLPQRPAPRDIQALIYQCMEQVNRLNAQFTQQRDNIVAHFGQLIAEATGAANAADLTQEMRAVGRTDTQL